MDDLIARTLVSRRTMYKHFPSKTKLIVATLEYYCTAYETDLNAHLGAMGDADAVEKLVGVLEYSYEWYQT